MSNETVAPKIVPPSAQLQFYDIIFRLVAFILIGIAGVVANIFIMAVIGTTKKLQSPCFMLICLECVFALVCALGFLVLGVLTAVQLPSPLPPIRPRWLCYLTNKFCMNFGLQGSDLAICVVALDRLASIIIPTRYQVAGGKYIRGCWMFCLGCVLALTFLAMLEYPSGLNDPVACSAGGAGGSGGVGGPFKASKFVVYFSNSNLIFSVLCVILYGTMLMAFWIRTKSITDPRAAQSFLKSQRACIPTVKLLMIFYVITAVLHEIYVNVSILSPIINTYGPRIKAYTSPLRLTSTLAEITALYFGSTAFRARVKGILGMKQTTTKVTQMAASNSSRKGQQSVARRTVGQADPTPVTQ